MFKKKKKKNSCVVCQKQFEKKRWNQITCLSKSCKLERERQKSKKWRVIGSKPGIDGKDLNRFKKIVYTDKTHFEKAETSKLPKECSVCGLSIHKRNTHTEECKRQRAKERQRHNWAIRIGHSYADCLICKKTFRKVARGKYCSKECFVKARAMRRVIRWYADGKYKCGCCGGLLSKHKLKKYPKLKYCSPICAKKAHDEANKKRYKTKRIKLRKKHPEKFLCSSCNQVVPIDSKYRNYCSETCNERKYNLYYQKNKPYYQRYYREVLKGVARKAKELKLGRNIPKIIPCLTCKKKFERLDKKGHYNKKTCSYECALKARRLSVNKSLKKQQERKRILEKTPKTYLPLVFEESICKTCGNKFKGYGSAKTCSLECKWEYLNYRRRQEFLKANPKSKVGNCENCNKEFTKKNGSQITCSSECQKERRKKRELIRSKLVSYCKNCLKKFKLNLAQKFCSPECKKEKEEKLLEKGRQRLEEKLKTNKICLSCGKFFLKKIKGLVCSKKCRDDRRRIKQKQEWHAKRKLKKPKIIIRCLICSKDFAKKGFDKTCSKECSHALKKERWRTIYHKTKGDKSEARLLKILNSISPAWKTDYKKVKDNGCIKSNCPIPYYSILKELKKKMRVTWQWLADYWKVSEATMRRHSRPYNRIRLKSSRKSKITKEVKRLLLSLKPHEEYGSEKNQLSTTELSEILKKKNILVSQPTIHKFYQEYQKKDKSLVAPKNKPCVKCGVTVLVKYSYFYKRYGLKNSLFHYTKKETDRDKFICFACMKQVYFSDQRRDFFSNFKDLQMKKNFTARIFRNTNKTR